jgi:hypothetical protein
MAEGVMHEVPLLPFEEREAAETTMADLMPKGEPEAEEVQAAAEQGEAQETEDTDAQGAELSGEDAEGGNAPTDAEAEAVTPEEREKGYLREQDYHRKTEALAAERKAVEAEKATIAQARAKYEAEARAYAEALTSILTEQEPTDAEWEALRQQDEGKYAAARLDWERVRAEQRTAAAVAEQARAEREAEQAREIQAVVAEHRKKLFEAVPEWESEAKPNFEYAKSMGFSDDELATAYDHRTLILLRKARLYDELMSKGAEQIAEKKVTTAKVLQPGSRDNTPKRDRGAEERRKLIQRAGRSREDALAAFRAIPADY